MNYQPTKGANCDRENYQVKSPFSVKSIFYSVLKSITKLGEKNLAFLHNSLSFFVSCNLKLGF